MAKHYFNLGKILQKLLYDKRINASELAREVDLPVPTVHRLVTGKSTRPYKTSLKPIADYFNVEVEQLLGEKPLFANEEADITRNRALASSHISYVPFKPWEELSCQTQSDQTEKIPYIGSIGSDAFATIMPDTSMEPFIQNESLLIFDPSISVKDRSFVLVMLDETKTYAVRQILIDASHKYLKSLNPDLSSFKMRLLDEKDTVIACLVETRNKIIGPKYKEIQ